MLMVRTMLPLFLFMLLPVWLPLIGAVFGAIFDRVTPRRVSPAEAAVNEAKARSARNRLSVIPGDPVPGETSIAA